MALAPFKTFENILDRMFDATIPRHLSLNSSRQTFNIDMAETDSEYVIQADLPGVDRSDINVHVNHGVLTVSAERNHSSEREEGGRYYFSERSYGSVSRNVPLPDDVDEDNVKAKYENGVLTLHLTKTPSKGVRSIVVE